jgi:osmotically-inducible protein OsmY
MTDTYSEIANALHWDLAVPRHRVSAKVENGVVTLRGEVERPYEKSRAEAIARQASGVVAVRNEITVRQANETYPRWATL